MLIKIWERHLFCTLIQLFFFFLLGFFFLYTILDYSTHMQDFVLEGKFQTTIFLQYYLQQFLKRANLLLPLSTMTASIKVMLSLNTSRELVALLTAGLKKNKLVRPFLVLAILCTVFNWLNAQLFLPKALTAIEKHKESQPQEDATSKRPFYVCRISLDSTLIFQKKSADMQTLWDVFWVKEPGKVWRMKKLCFSSGKAVGFFVDELVKDNTGSLLKERSFSTYIFNEIKLKNISIAKPKTQQENLSLSNLYKITSKKDMGSSREKTASRALFQYRIFIPLLSIAAVFCSLPYCMRYERSVPAFLIYTVSLFSFIAVYTFFDAALILCAQGTVNPLYLFTAPLGLAFWIGYRKLFKN